MRFGSISKICFHLIKRGESLFRALFTAGNCAYLFVLNFFYIISLYIQYLYVNLSHRSPRVMSWPLGDLRRIISLVVGPYFDMPPLFLPGLEPATPVTPTVLTRVRC